MSQSAGIERESLYRALSPKGNPRLSTLSAVLKALGMTIRLRAGMIAPLLSIAMLWALNPLWPILLPAVSLSRSRLPSPCRRVTVSQRPSDIPALALILTVPVVFLLAQALLT